MGKGGGGNYPVLPPEPTAAELRQQELQNTLLERQIADLDKPAQPAAVPYQETPQYVEDQARTAFAPAKTSSYNTVRDRIRGELTDAGLTEMLPDAYGRVDADFNNLTYDSGLGADVYGSKDYVGDIIRNTRTGRRDTAYNDALSRGSARLGSLGLNDLLDEFQTGLDTKKQGAGLNANTYTDVFNPDTIIDSVMGTERSNRRLQYGTNVNTAFSGYDPNKDFADTADDPYIADILGRDFSNAEGALQRARARGSLNDQGYGAATSFLGDQRKAADTTAQTLGGAVLTRNRDTLGGIKSKAATEAGAWDFGKSFDVNSFLNEYGGKRTELGAGLGGEVANALAGQKWFDIGDVLTKGGYAQGAQNTPALASGFATPASLAAKEARDRLAIGQRGLGGSSTF